MKNKETEFESLADTESDLYCGSACIYTLFPIIKSLTKCNKDFLLAFPDFEELLEKMVVEDGKLFAFTKKTTPYSDMDWNELTMSLADNGKMITYIDNLILWCEDGFIAQYQGILQSDLVFMKNLLLNSLKVFYEIPNHPTLFSTTAANCMQAIRGNSYED